MIPLLAKSGLAVLTLKWRLALTVPLLVGERVPSEDAKSLKSEDDLITLLRDHPERLGSVSVGKPSRGALLNGVTPSESGAVRVMAKHAAYGTEETVAAIELAARRMQELFPNSSPLVVGDISDKDGGKLRPHLSHQSGRDVDLGFYYVDKPTWYRRANAKNLDLARTWSLIRTLVTETDVEMIFIDQGLQSILLDYARAHETDQEWVQLLFKGAGVELPTIRHARGHATHLHVRFYSPRAQKLGQELYPLLVAQSIVPKAESFVSYTAKKGDSLEKLAKRFGVTVKQLKAANGMKGNTIIAKLAYRIPGKQGVSPDTTPLVLPPRRVPRAATPVNQGTVSASATNSTQKKAPQK